MLPYPTIIIFDNFIIFLDSTPLIALIISFHDDTSPATLTHTLSHILFSIGHDSNEP